MNELRSTSSDIIELLIDALELSSHPVTVSYVEALREVLRLRAIIATGQKWNDELRAENERLREHREDLSRDNARLNQLLSGRDENLLSRETHE